MKKCPFCAEEIQAQAIVCKHCGRDIDTPPVAAPTPTESRSTASVTPSKGYGNAFLWTVGLLLLMLLITPVPVLLISALVVAVDSRNYDFKKYKTGVSGGPVALFLMVCLLWIVAFPMYVAKRTQIKTGMLIPNDSRQVPRRTTSPVVWAVLAMLVIVFGYLMNAISRPDTASRARASASSVSGGTIHSSAPNAASTQTLERIFDAGIKEDMSCSQLHGLSDQLKREKPTAYVEKLNDQLRSIGCHDANAQRPSKAHAPSSNLARPATISPAFSTQGVDFIEIRSNMENKTELQFDEYAKSLEGKSVNWSGWVEEVEKKLFGGYSVQVDMDPPASLSVPDVTIVIQADALAMKLEKGAKIQFTGTIKHVMNILGTCQVTLSNPRIL